MEAFDIHRSVIADYKKYLKSFLLIKDDKIRTEVERAFEEGTFLPEALIQFNPSYEAGESLADLEATGKVHPDMRRIFQGYSFHRHQEKAIRKAVNDGSFVVTSGTGSGKSLTYLYPIFNSVLQAGAKPGLRAIIVYPMNALINSQEEEIKKYEIKYLKSFLPTNITINEAGKSLDEILSEARSLSRKTFPITYGKYTGQEDESKRELLRSEHPHIILTNYMMLELIMTRNSEKWLREEIAKNLEYLVFDELHTYRGRQGSDVSMLIRRIKSLCHNELQCVGTSATMASGGSPMQRKEAVAKVATQIFSKYFTADDIIGETLAACTDFGGSLPNPVSLQNAIEQEIDVSSSVDEFVKNPLAIWLENRIALHRVDAENVERGEPRSFSQILNRLAEDANLETAVCSQPLLNLLEWTERLNIKGAGQFPRKSYLPFKVHQFISQTGMVSVTLEEKATRKVTLQMGTLLRIDGEDKPVFPVLFSRYSGHEFLCVKKQDGKLIPRLPDELPERITRESLKGDRQTGKQKRVLKEEDFPDGYLLIEDVAETIWDESHEEFLPERWKSRKKGEKFDNFFAHRLPKRIFFNQDGEYSADEKYPLKGWFIPTRLLLDPTSGVVFENEQKDSTKLMRLGNEGRSTATTVISYSILKNLTGHGFDTKSSKLLSFTDNRQDASLQSGHFNDFLMVGRLRSAIYHALLDVPNQALTHDTITEAVFKKLALSESEYATYPSPDPDWPDEANEKAVKDYILLRIFYDLKRGWRYNTPNLEQCGLLEIDYHRLDEFCQRETFFEHDTFLRNLSPDERKRFLTQILNFFRTSYAFEHPKLLDNRAELEERLRYKLDDAKLWSLDKDEKIEVPNILLPISVGKTKKNAYTVGISSKSYVGRFLKRSFKQIDHRLRDGITLTAYIDSLCQLLVRGHFLTSVNVKGDKKEAAGYRLRVDKIVWKLGNGIDVLPDRVRTAAFKEIETKPNTFFQEFYKQEIESFQQLGREHTGQISNDDRIEREDKFRKGEIQALFCSPTMELGIDISELNVVHMRNVPPSPANYAQRSGRAGRSGQAALVFTYCSNGSPHDRNYFKESRQMVSGKVTPPKIDLTNEELILSHFNAFILMELGLSDLKTSVADVVELSQSPEFPLKESIRAHIEDHINRYAADWADSFSKIITNLPEFEKVTWYTPEKIFAHAQSFLRRFDVSFDRWRKLYISADKLIQKAHETISDIILAKENTKLNEAKREQSIGLRQRTLLLNEAKRSFGGESEFYVYRFLASEGFLPGYNFTRLPVRAFLGYRHKDKGEFVSRSRFIALREFGPNNLIYHNGGKFAITRMQITQAEALRHTIKISKTTGYAFLDEEAKGVNNDPITNRELKGQDHVELYNNLLWMDEAEARPKERISCEEEDRTTRGFDIDQFFSFSKGIDSTKQAVIRQGGQDLLRIIYDQSARLIQINKNWRASRNENGFAIGSVSGKWKKAKDLKIVDSDDPAIDVRLYSTGTADILYIQPVKQYAQSEEGVVTLAYALKRAVERKFQVEENEIGVWIMGGGEERNILLYEAAEGSLGILSQLVTSGQTLKETFTAAYEILHFDPVTLQDTKADTEPKASYNNLQSYYNQRYHNLFDRFLVKEILERLMDCELDPQQGGKTQESQYQLLMENYDPNSSTEKKFIQYLKKNGYALPDKAQVNVPDLYVSADFIYKTANGCTLVFCDGSVHDDPMVRAADQVKRQHCRDAGYDVIEWHYNEPIDELVERRKDIFRKIR